ncbi:NAD-dependent epimerase [Enterococcus xiangfangensis]|uniref:NAD-dependent epimerase n=1 Tax=Enterococcus xiangfangensis TaxID=1296537 RepID=A0ABU3FBZ8_9ENTE|nr:NAD-dependent epimerase [Enterococcus xiangfangensis]MDT2759592.1 NAD-dependent epimerase [Enterococcus xiangfangensis]
MKLLVTGSAGFIGYHLVKQLLHRNQDIDIIGIDNLNDYYEVNLKKNRLAALEDERHFEFLKKDISDKEALFSLFAKEKFDVVINLAAQAGVRYSLENPQAYIDSNVTGFFNILEACRKFPVKHLLYASSSSVYGGNKKIPFSTEDNVDHPVSLYAATKKSNELMAHSYSHLFGIPTTGLRFFTVYGPWGRPDMAYFSFTKNIIEGNTIKIFNNGKMKRDFTYIDDIVEGIARLIDNPPTTDPDWTEENGSSSSWAPYKIYNIGNNHPIELMRFVNILEEKIGKEVAKEFHAMQPGDVIQTYADVSDLEKKIGFKPTTSLEEGLGQFVDWYKDYYKI